MAREMILMLDGKDYNLVASWRASMAITETVYDPLLMAKDAMLALHFQKHNIPYESKFDYSLENTVQILHCALRANGYDLTIDEVGDAVINGGAAKYVAKADEYIAMIVDNGSAELEGGKPTGKP